MELQPLILLRTHHVAPASTAVDLQLGGYLVSRVFDDELALFMLRDVAPDAIVVDLGAHERKNFLARLEDDQTPVFVIASRSMQRHELIASVDRMLIDCDQNLMRSSSCFAEAAGVEYG